MLLCEAGIVYYKVGQSLLQNGTAFLQSGPGIAEWGKS